MKATFYIQGELNRKDKTGPMEQIFTAGVVESWNSLDEEAVTVDAINANKRIQQLFTRRIEVIKC